MPTRLAALLAAGLSVAAPGADAKPPVAAKPAPALSATTGPITRQLGLPPAPFKLFILITEVGRSGPIPNLTSAGDLLYQGWCNLYGFNASGADSVHVSPNGIVSNGPKLDAMTLSRGADATTTTLFSRLVTGRPCDFTFVVVRDAPDRIEAWKIKCTGAYVSGQGFQSSEGAMYEDDTITFTTIEWSYLETDANGKVLDEIFGNYNVSTGTTGGGTRAATYPGGQDSNKNGIPDGWETFYGLDLSNPNNATYYLDCDGK